jgi:hypothetical protein
MPLKCRFDTCGSAGDAISDVRPMIETTEEKPEPICRRRATNLEVITVVRDQRCSRYLGQSRNQGKMALTGRLDSAIVSPRQDNFW